MAASDIENAGLSQEAEGTYNGFMHLMGYGAIATFLVAMAVVFIIAT